MKFLKHLYLPIMLIGFGICSGAEIYVSPEGSDGAPGSAEAPFRTLAEASDVAQPGDTVIILTGVYRETLRPKRSGTSRAPITFQAAPGARVVVTGLDEIRDWEKRPDGLWEADVGWNSGHGMNQIFFDGEPLTEARHPNKRSMNVMEHNLSPLRFPEEGIAQGSAFSSDLENQWAGAYFLGHGYEAWSYQCAKIQSSKGDRLVFDPETKSEPWFEKPMGWGDPKRLEIGEGAGFLFGLPQFLDVPGEWFWQKDRITLIPPSGKEVGESLIEARKRALTLDIDGKDHIVVRGLSFKGGSMRIHGADNVLEDCEGKYLAHFFRFPLGYSSSGGVEHGVGIEVDGERNQIRGCHISRTAGAGIELSGRENLVTRCLVEETNYAGVYGACINVGGANQRIIFNTLRRAGRDCLHLNNNFNPSLGGHAVYLNDISRPGLVCMDVGIVYFFGNNGQARDGTKTRIAYNWVHDNPKSNPAPGIYLDNYVRNYRVDHNVIWNVPNDAAIRINAPTFNNWIHNNTVFNSGPIGSNTYNQYPRFNTDPAFWTDGDLYELYLFNNLDLKDNPEAQLVSPSEFNFSLKPGSPAIGAGKPGVRKNGKSHRVSGRDLGAYQTDANPWIPGHLGTIEPGFLPVEYLQDIELKPGE